MPLPIPPIARSASFIISAFIGFCFLIVFSSPASLAQSSGAENPDEAMTRFAEAWSNDDNEAIEALLADDVVLLDGDDVVVGRKSVVDWLGSRMGATGAFEFVPERAETDGTFAYQTGDWSLTRGEGAALGEHTFVFEQNGEAEWLLAAVHLQRDVINAEGSGNNAFATAFGIGLNQPVEDRISERGQIDYFEILVPESGVLDAVLEPVPPDQRLSVELFDAEQRQVAGGRAAGPGGRAVAAGPTEPGRYYLRVQSNRGSHTSEASYTLTATLDRTDTYEINDTFAQAAEIELGEAIVGTIRPLKPRNRRESDYYKLSVAQAGPYQFALDPVPPELRMTVAAYDATQKPIGGNNAGGVGQSLFFEADLPAGVVFIEVGTRLRGPESVEPYTLRITKK